MLKPLMSVALVVSALAIGGCRRVALDVPIESMTLYSLDGNFTPGYDKPRKGAVFHDYPVLGKTNVASAADRRTILAAILKGIEENRGREAKCFWPHHGVSLMQNGKRIEFLICFHCLQVYMYADGAATKQLTSRPPCSTHILKKAACRSRRKSRTERARNDEGQQARARSFKWRAGEACPALRWSGSSAGVGTPAVSAQIA